MANKGTPEGQTHWSPANGTATNEIDPSEPRSYSRYGQASYPQPNYQSQYQSSQPASTLQSQSSYSQPPQVLQYHEKLWKHHEAQDKYHQSLEQYYRTQSYINPEQLSRYHQEQRQHHQEQSWFHQEQASYFPNEAQSHRQRAEFHQGHVRNYDQLINFPSQPQSPVDSHRVQAEYHRQLAVYHQQRASPSAVQPTPSYSPPASSYQPSEPPYQPATQPYQRPGAPYAYTQGAAYQSQGNSPPLAFSQPGPPNQAPTSADMLRNYTHTSSGPESAYLPRQPVARIEGTPGETDLDPEYVIQKKPHKFFIPGRVFMVLWTEPAGGKGHGTRYTMVRFGEVAFTEIRRFVVIRQMRDSSWCLPIHSYGRQGTLKRSANPGDHAIIYTSAEAPKPLEGEMMTKRPLRVIPDSLKLTLDPMSRINFGKVYTVEHNIKARKLGVIADESEHLLDLYFRQVTDGDVRGSPLFYVLLTPLTPSPLHPFNPTLSSLFPLNSHTNGVLTEDIPTAQ